MDKFLEFNVPPAKGSVIIGKMAPVAMKFMEKAFNAAAPEQFVKIPIEHKTIEEIVIRKAALKKIPGKKISEFIIKETEKIMDETDISKFDLSISIRISEKIHLGNRETILVVEDDSVVLQAVKNILSILNYKVLTASDAGKAMDMLKKYGKKICLVLMDYTLPDINGTGLFKKIKAYKTDLKVIIMSGYSLEREIRDIQKMGLAGFIQKPFTEEMLAQTLSKLL